MELYVWQMLEGLARGKSAHSDWIPLEAKQVIDFANSYSTLKGKELVNADQISVIKGLDVRERPVDSLSIKGSESTDKTIYTAASEKKDSCASKQPSQTISEAQTNKPEKKTAGDEDGKTVEKGKDESGVENG